MRFSNLILSFLNRFLNIGTIPQQSDCIFVFAGRDQRKYYGLKLFKEGIAGQIIFSVGRYEWRRFLNMGIIDRDLFENLVNKTPPPMRHFFVVLNGEYAKAYRIKKKKFGTLSEALALAQFISEKKLKKVVIVSSGYHLKRSVGCIRRFHANDKLKVIPVAAQEEEKSEIPNSLKAFVDNFGIIFVELFKYCYYKLLVINSAF